MIVKTLSKNFNKTFKFLCISAPIMTLMSGAFFLASKAQAKRPLKKIEKLTSEKSASKYNGHQTEIPASTFSNNPGQLKTHAVGIGLGQTFLKGEFENHGEDAITPELYYLYRASYSFDMLANFHYSKHSFKTEETQLMGLSLALKGNLYHFDSFTPFALGGLGFYAPRVIRKLENDQTIQSSSKVTFGIHLGVGGELRLNRKFSVGALAHYHNPFDFKQEVGPKVKGSYVKLLLTGFYTF